MIRFQQSYRLDNSKKYIDDALLNNHLEGDGFYTHQCQQWLKERLNALEVLMMTSCTHALECALDVIQLNRGDEVIIPSFTFPSTANAVLMAGGKVVFCEVEPVHLTIDVAKLEEKIGPKTKAVVVVHYGGLSCDMDRVMELAKKYSLIVIEDCAQSFMAKYKDKYTGTIGHLGCYSFHGTKDIVSGEGGALVINEERFLQKAKIIRQKGTNRDAFLEGDTKFYEWVSKGSSYSPAELLMALLLGQLELSDEILQRKRAVFSWYESFFNHLTWHELESFSTCEKELFHNGHLFYLLFKDEQAARLFKHYMIKSGIDVRTHFVPLHESSMGKQFIISKNNFTVEHNIGSRLIRLPLYADLKEAELEVILKVVSDYTIESRLL